ncbi:MAG: PKD domain-containing protein [Thermoplasmata archaeon]|nr:PKD domain-containing protein [Thermoplasmata archaeon]
MGRWVPRLVLWALVTLVLAGTLASVSGARAASSTSYTLLGYVEQNATVGFAPVPAGVSVQLTSQATDAVYTAQTTSASGQFNFTSASTSNALGTGWWSLYVPPQVGRLSAFGCTPCAVLPSSQNPTWYFENQTTLTSTNNPVYLQNVSYLPFNGTITGNVTYGTQKVPGATVQLLAPKYNGFVLASNTTNKNGTFNISAPWGNWVLVASIPANPPLYSYNAVTVSGSALKLNPAIHGYETSGFINVNSVTGPHVPNGGNATVVDLTNHYLYTTPTPAGGYYTVATYPAGFNYGVGGAATYTVILSPVGYNTTSYPLTVSGANPSGGSPINVAVKAISAPATYLTTLNFSVSTIPGFGKLNVTTIGTLGPNSVLPELPNASVGDLWAQLALDTQHNLSFSAARLPWLYSYLGAEGPFFPAGQAQTMVNGTGFGQPTNGTFVPTSTCVSFCGLASSASVGLAWYQNYNVTAKIPTSAKTYTLSFNFRHPTNGQSINYTVVLPAGWVLSAGNPVPAQSLLKPGGPGGTWTKFTLVGKPSTSAWGSATFNLVKYANLTANVNISAQNFTFSKLNVVNSTRSGYTVIVGQGQNVSFSAINSTFPAGTNGTSYKWYFGDSATPTVSGQPTSYHTYLATGNFSGNVTVTGSGGLKNATSFHVLVGNLAPTAVISQNDTKPYAKGTLGSTPFIVVNWSTGIRFNASASSSPLYPTSTRLGVLSIASFNFSSYKFTPKPFNVSANGGGNPKVNSNNSFAFLGAGHYLSMSVPNVTGTFSGWQYNLTLTVWDGQGHRAMAQMIIFVRDTEKPVAVAGLLNAAGHATTSLVEAANGTAFVGLNGANSTDPHNGSILTYNWTISNKGNSSVKWSYLQTAKPSAYTYPGKLSVWLAPQTKAYSVNLTVVDRAGNSNYNVGSVTIGINTSTRPVLSVANLTGATTLTAGTQYTYWANVTNTIGLNSTATGVQVRFYILPPSGGGSQIGIGNSPASVSFWNYTSTGALNSTPQGTGSTTLKFNHTIQAKVTWTPARTGTWSFYVNATAANEFPGTYGPNVAHIQININPNPTTQYEEYGAIAGAVILVIVAIVVFYRRRSSPASGKSSSSGRSGLLRGGSSKKDDKDEDEDDDEK